MIHGYRALCILGGSTIVFFWSTQSLASECEPTFAKIALHLASPTSKAIPCGMAEISCSSADSLRVAGELDQDYTAYVLLTHPSANFSVQQVQIGAHYDGTEGSGVDVFSFQSCATYSVVPIGSWPDPGSELVMSWAACQFPSENEALVLGYFGLVAHTPGTFSVTNLFGPGPHTVPRLVDCAGTERIIEPYYVSQLEFGEAGIPFDTCSSWMDFFPGPCCLADSCVASTSVGCCWARGGTPLAYDATCASCVTPVITKTWGQLKSRYE